MCLILANKTSVISNGIWFQIKVLRVSFSGIPSEVRELTLFPRICPFYWTQGGVL
jgi:hypothetical protein